DDMLRLTQGNHPDGGQTTFTYPIPIPSHGRNSSPARPANYGTPSPQNSTASVAPTRLSTPPPFAPYSRTPRTMLSAVSPLFPIPIARAAITRPTRLTA